MGMLTESLLLDVVLCLSGLLALLYWYLSRVYGYFRCRGVPYLPPVPLVGHTWLFTQSQTDIAHTLYNSLPGERFYGFFQSVVPTYVIKNPELIQKILIKDFSHFYDRGFPTIDKDVLFKKNLFNLRGQPWRSLRNKLVPTFTSGKIKYMFEQFLKSGDHVTENLEEKLEKPVDAKLLSVEFGTEVIASIAFGIDLSKSNPQTAEFVEKASSYFKKGLNLIMFTATVAPKLADILGISMFRSGTMEYFTNLTKATKEYRKQKGVKRNDYFDLLLSLQEQEESGKTQSASLAVVNSEEDALINQMEHAPEDILSEFANTTLLSDEVMTAQSFVYLIAGSDSISGTLSFAMYHIAKDAGIQRRLSEEIHVTVSKHSSWTHQAVRDMVFLDQVLQETLRLYPIMGSLYRECTLPYRIPDSSVTMEKGTKVIIPIVGLHKDPQYYPEPELFKPERFANNNYKPSSTYLPFGDGPRICIAMRFAIAELKVCLAKILSKYTIAVNKKTQEPFAFDKESLSTKPVGGIWLDFKRKSQLELNFK